jgi:hypothetical protein
LEQLRVAQTQDAKNLQQQVDDLDGKNREFETTVEILTAEVKIRRRRRNQWQPHWWSHCPPLLGKIL